MPRKGYSTVTLKSDVISHIDGMIEPDEKQLKSRSKVVETAISRLLEVQK